MSKRGKRSNTGPPAAAAEDGAAAEGGGPSTTVSTTTTPPTKRQRTASEGEPQSVSFQDISTAAFRIRDGVMKTPIHKAHDEVLTLTGVDLYFKKDYLLPTGSFKERGARNSLKLLTGEQKQKGVIAASAGNHALALSYHGKDLGIPVTVVMPMSAPLVKVSRCKTYGANVMQHGAHIGDAKVYAQRLSKERGLRYINGYDDPEIIAGQGTAGLELMEFPDIHSVDAVLVPIGGGGLVAGVALALKTLQPSIEIIGVEPQRCASWQAALDAGRPVNVDLKPTLADGLAVPKVGANAFHVAKDKVDRVVLVSESYIALAVLKLMELEAVIVEGGGAIGLAALLTPGLLPDLNGKKVISFLCGSNIDVTVVGRCVDRGLALEGRLVRFQIIVADAPGGISSVCDIVARMGCSIKDMYHERAWLESDVFTVAVIYTVETRGKDHVAELRRTLDDNGYKTKWGF